MSYLLVFSLLCLSMSYFATGQFSHFRAVHGVKLTGIRRQRQLLSAWGILFGGLLAACLVKGFAHGSLIWIGLLTPAALFVLLILQQRSTWLQRIRVVALLLCLFSLIALL
ncbi:hypothetical protein GCM10009092_01320 [Bowmanella denitrificans]|uniref:DUF3325 domain-containing protein n=1 Tax=Bowmanella denitrificans TaxID=366582 RepID=A0ABN0WKI7_9ALTE